MINRLYRAAATQETTTNRRARWRVAVIAVGLFLLAVACGFYLGFPDEILKQRLAYELGYRLPVNVDMAEVRLRPLLSLHGTNIRIRLPGSTDDLLKVDRLTCAPLWSGLLSGSPGLKGHLVSGDGSLNADWHTDGTLTSNATNFTFDVPIANSPASRVRGRITTGQLKSAIPLRADAKSQLDLSLDEIVVSGLEALTSSPGGLRFGQVSLVATGQGATFTIQRLATTGGDLVAAGEGRMILSMANPEHSRLNLTLSVRAGQDADPVLAGLLELVGTAAPDGSRLIRLTGTLANPIAR